MRYIIEGLYRRVIVFRLFFRPFLVARLRGKRCNNGNRFASRCQSARKIQSSCHWFWFSVNTFLKVNVLRKKREKKRNEKNILLAKYRKTILIYEFLIRRNLGEPLLQIESIYKNMNLASSLPFYFISFIWARRFLDTLVIFYLQRRQPNNKLKVFLFIFESDYFCTSVKLVRPNILPNEWVKMTCDQ